MMPSDNILFKSARTDSFSTSCFVAAAECTGMNQGSFKRGPLMVSPYLVFLGVRRSRGCLWYLCFAVRWWWGLSIAIVMTALIIFLSLIYGWYDCRGAVRVVSRCCGSCGTRCLELRIPVTGCTSCLHDLCLGQGHNRAGWMSTLTRIKLAFANHQWLSCVLLTSITAYNVKCLRLPRFSSSATLKSMSPSQLRWLHYFLMGGVVGVSTCPDWSEPTFFCLNHSIWPKGSLPRRLCLSSQW